MNTLLKTENSKAHHWYIWYTRPRSEKKLYERLTAKGIEAFLPLRKELRQWSDRKKWVQSPLFNGYIFTRIQDHERDKVSFTEGILNYVRFSGKPAFLSDQDVESILRMLQSFEDLEIEDAALAAGEYVEIIAGPLNGMRGELIDIRGRSKVALRIEQLGKALLAEVPISCIHKVDRA